MRDRYGEFEQKGITVATVAMGTPLMAQDFKQERSIPWPVLVDPKRESYKALGLKKGGLLQIAGPKEALGSARHFFGTGELPGKPKEDQSVWQLGGALAVKKGGEVALVHRATEASDNIPPQELLEALV